jgi:hypothetical protein
VLAHGRWFSLGTPASSTTKTSHHDIAEILLKMVLNTNNQSINHIHYPGNICSLKNYMYTGTHVVKGINVMIKIIMDSVLGDLIFWCLTPLSAIFQLYHGDQF